MKAAMSTKHTLKLSSVLDILFHFVAFPYMQKLCRMEHRAANLSFLLEGLMSYYMVYCMAGQN